MKDMPLPVPSSGEKFVTQLYIYSVRMAASVGPAWHDYSLREISQDFVELTSPICYRNRKQEHGIIGTGTGHYVTESKCIDL